MESGRNKRKMGNEEDGGDDEEEEKVEMFFALIRSTREMRDRLRNVPNATKEEEGRKEQQQEKQQAAAAVWNPKFQPEDFMEDSKSKKNPLAVNDQEAGPSSKTEQEQGGETKEGEEDTDLDLKLSL